MKVHDLINNLPPGTIIMGQEVSEVFESAHPGYCCICFVDDWYDTFPSNLDINDVERWYKEESAH